MHKKIKLISLFTALAVILCGCVHQTQEVKISSDGSVVESIVCYIDKTAAEMDDSSAGTGSTTINGKDISTLPVVEYNGVECYKDEEINTYKSLSEYSESFSSDESEMAAKLYYISTDTIYYSIDAESIKQALLMYDMAESKLKATYVISYVFDNPIVDTNGVIDTVNPNKVTYTFTASEAVDEIYVTTSNTVNKDKLKESYEKAQASKIKKVKSLTVKKKSATAVKLTWKKDSNAKKYQIQYSTKQTFANKKTKTTTKKTITIKKLKKGKTYYFRVRGKAGSKVGEWSRIKKLKIKK